MFTHTLTPSAAPRGDLENFRQNANTAAARGQTVTGTNRSDPESDLETDAYPSQESRRNVLIVVAAGSPGLSAVAQRGARLAAALDSGLVLHLLRLGKPAATEVQNNEHYISALQDATNIVPASRMRLTEIIRDNAEDYIRDVGAVLQPNCIVMANDLRGTGDYHGPLTAKAIVESCGAPLWLVAPDASSVRPIVVAAIDSTSARPESNTLNRTILENAARFSVWLNASLHVFHAAYAFDVSTRMLVELQQLQRTAIDQWLHNENVAVQQVHVPVGLPDVELAKFAEIHRPSMVVVGAARRSTWKRYFHYDVTMATAKSLPADLLVVHRDATVLRDIGVRREPGYGARDLPNNNSRAFLE